MTTADATARHPSSVVGRLIGMVWSPRATLAEVVERPVWLGMLLLTLAVPAVGGALLLSTEVGQRALVERQVEALEGLGLEVTDEQYERFDQFAPYAASFQLVSVAVWIPLLAVVVSAVLFVVGHVFLGSDFTFRQIYAVVVHAGVAFVVQAIFVGPLNYVRGELANPATLAAFVPMLDVDSFTVRLLSVIDLFLVWWIVLLAVGTSVATTARTPPIAVGLLGVYAGVAVVIALVMTQLGS